MRIERLQHPNKRIIVCLDGTWNKPEKPVIDPNKKPEPTNILQIVRGVKTVDDTDHDNLIAQIVYYDEGVGTDAGLYDKIIGGALGVGLSKHVRRAYRFIANNYRQGDHIFLFGFSRGAFTARTLAGFIGYLGIIRTMDLKLVPEAYKVYRESPEVRKQYKFFKTAESVRKKSISAPLEFIGVFDTVGALGPPTPGLGWITKKLGRIGFHNTQLGDNVKGAYHALAADERRRPFHPDLWTGTKPTNTEVEQVWFAGVHSNIGGSYKNTVLSDITLRWMVDRAMRHGLKFHDELVNLTPGPIPTGRIEKSFKLGYQLLRFTGVQPYQREIGPYQNGDIRKRNEAALGESVHSSAKDMVDKAYAIDYRHNDKGEPYKPDNLSQAIKDGINIDRG